MYVSFLYLESLHFRRLYMTLYIIMFQFSHVCCDAALAAEIDHVWVRNTWLSLLTTLVNIQSPRLKCLVCQRDLKECLRWTLRAARGEEKKGNHFKAIKLPSLTTISSTFSSFPLDVSLTPLFNLPFQTVASALLAFLANIAP